MIDLAVRRQIYAEELQARCALRNEALVSALSSVPRERFLHAGPWTFRGDGDLGGPPHQTPDVRMMNPVAIYSAIGLRDEALNTELGAAFSRVPYPALKQLRRDPHETTAACWLHTERFCFTTEA